eukprot:15466515-Alexandrium_andersonii.AAC.1
MTDRLVTDRNSAQRTRLCKQGSCHNADGATLVSGLKCSHDDSHDSLRQPSVGAQQIQNATQTHTPERSERPHKSVTRLCLLCARKAGQGSTPPTDGM